jgi:hypothetical protein
MASCFIDIKIWRLNAKLEKMKLKWVSAYLHVREQRKSGRKSFEAGPARGRRSRQSGKVILHVGALADQVKVVK